MKKMKSKYACVWHLTREDVMCILHDKICTLPECTDYIAYDDPPNLYEPHEGYNICSHCRAHKHEDQREDGRASDCKTVFTVNGETVGQCMCYNIRHGIHR